MARRNRVPSPQRKWRDLGLYLAGMAGLGYETLVEHNDRPTLLIVFAGMVGLPVFLGRDPGDGDDEGDDDEPPAAPRKRPTKNARPRKRAE